MPISTYLGNALLSTMVKGVSFTPIDTVYISLHSADPGDSGANEYATGNYTRKTLTASQWRTVGAFLPKWVGNTENGGVSWTVSNWGGSVGWVGVWDSLSGGNFLVYGHKNGDPVTVTSGDVITIDPAEDPGSPFGSFVIHL